MEIKNIVTTEEQSKRLDELWFKKEGCFSYYRNWEIHPTLEWPYCLYPAYTASELMEYLPSSVEIYKHISNSSYIVFTWWDDDYRWDNENLTQALWDMLIYLIEKSLLPNNE